MRGFEPPHAAFRKRARFQLRYTVLAGTERVERSSSGSEPDVLATELRANVTWGTVRDSNPVLAFRRRTVVPSHGAWSTRRESNSHPSPSEGDAHPIELRVDDLVDAARIELASAGLQGRCRPLRPSARTGARRQNRTDVTEFAALRLATRQVVPEELERIAGLEPALSRWQRAVLAAGRYPHGVRGRTRTLSVNVRSVEPRPWDANFLLWSGRRESNPYPELGRLVRSHYATPALVSRASPSREGTTPTGDRGRNRTRRRSALETESAPVPHGQHFARSFRGDRWDSNPLIRGPQPRAHPIEPRPHRNDRTGALRRRRTDVRSLQGSARCASVQGITFGALGASRTRYLSDTNGAFSRVNFECSTAGADDRARTDTFSLTRRAHCLSCSIRAHFQLADPAGFEPAISCVTGRRGRPGSSMSPETQSGCGHGS